MSKTKLYILTGFLGSGKTTILLELIEKLKGKRIGIIQNEFGKLGIDGEILKNDEIEMVEINRGSIFCSCLKLNFVGALIEMSKHDFDYLFVESSGLGDPSNVEEILAAVEAASDRSYDFAGVICLVDAYNFKNQIGDLETVERQLKHCNLAVINKIDLVEEDEVLNLEKEIRSYNPVCKLLSCSFGKLDYEFLDEDLQEYKWAKGEESTNTVETKPKTLFMQVKEPVDVEELLAFLKDIVPYVYRVKGFAMIREKGMCKVDLVGDRIDIKKTDAEHESELVFISRIGAAVIRELIGCWEHRVTTEMKLKN